MNRNPKDSWLIKARQSTQAKLALLFFAALTTTGCLGWDSSCPDCYDSKNADPVYLSYNDLRSGITVGDPVPLTDIQRVYVYQKTVFLNNKNRGLHVIDNSDPSNPENVAFISIPGNTEISIRDNALYADSYVDLVTLKIDDPANIVEQDREIDIFPYNAYQNIPDNIYFGYDNIDETKGVVVSYECTQLLATMFSYSISRGQLSPTHGQRST